MDTKKKKTHIYAVYKKPTSDLKTHKLKVRGWKNTFHAKGKQNKAGVTIFISDKIDLKIKKIIRDNDQGINPRGRHTIVHVFVPNIGEPQYIRQTQT